MMQVSRRPVRDSPVVQFSWKLECGLIVPCSPNFLIKILSLHFSHSLNDRNEPMRGYSRPLWAALDALLIIWPALMRANRRTQLKRPRACLDFGALNYSGTSQVSKLKRRPPFPFHTIFDLKQIVSKKFPILTKETQLLRRIKVERSVVSASSLCPWVLQYNHGVRGLQIALVDA